MSSLNLKRMHALEADHPVWFSNLQHSGWRTLALMSYSCPFLNVLVCKAGVLTRHVVCSWGDEAMDCRGSTWPLAKVGQRLPHIFQKPSLFFLVSGFLLFWLWDSIPESAQLYPVDGHLGPFLCLRQNHRSNWGMWAHLTLIPAITAEKLSGYEAGNIKGKVCFVSVMLIFYNEKVLSV